MRILSITPNPPARTQVNGGATRQYHLYKRLIDLGHEVVVVAPFPYGSRATVDELRAEGFIVHEHMRPVSLAREVAAAVVRKPSLLFTAFRQSYTFLVGAVYWVDIGPIAKRVLAEGSFDVLCLDDYAAPWIDELGETPPTVLVNHQVDSAYNAHRAERRSGIARWRALGNARHSLRMERKYTPRFSEVICMSDDEVELLSEIVGDAMPPARAIGNGADIEWLEDTGPDPDEHRVLFTGTMSFEPNAIGAQWLGNEVWPLVRGLDPEATLDIVGRDPSPATLALGEAPGITVHASVPEMKPFFSSASVCTLPMREGGGTRLKLAEAFAARRAVVATTNGATGVDVEAGRDLLIADSPSDFAAAIVDLLNDRERRAQLAAAGHAIAVEQLNWKKLGDRWESTLLEVAARAQGQNPPARGSS
ncbi:MAG: glycosyltransferase [Thermoleophilaceae bacterium]|nr:glycosyltransferase [Thermoleophilaceae bacterium]